MRSPVRHDGGWARADVVGTQSNAARAHGIQKNTKKESSRNFFQNSNAARLGSAQQSRHQQKECESGKFFIVFRNSKFSHLIQISI
jgi:hypothetical protein